MRTVAHLSDLHFGRHNPAIAEALLASLEETRPDLVIVSGDLTQRARRAEFAAAREFLSRIAAPKIVVPGNHDVPLYNFIRRLLTPFRHYETHVSPIGPISPFYVDSEIAALALNTARRLARKNGRVSWEQMDEIRRAFSGTPQCCLRILATHHPLGEPIGGLGLELVHRSKPALTAIADAGVDVLLSGHHHRASSGVITIGSDSGHSILIAHAGTAVSTRTRGSEDNSYNLIRFESDLVSVVIMTATAKAGFREGTITSYGRLAGVWQPVTQLPFRIRR